MCHKLVRGDLNFLSLPQNITLVHYIVDIILIEPSEQETTITLDLLVTHIWEITSTKIQEPATSVNFLVN